MQNIFEEMTHLERVSHRKIHNIKMRSVNGSVINSYLELMVGE